MLAPLSCTPILRWGLSKTRLIFPTFLDFVLLNALPPHFTYSATRDRNTSAGRVHPGKAVHRERDHHELR